MAWIYIFFSFLTCSLENYFISSLCGIISLNQWLFLEDHLLRCQHFVAMPVACGLFLLLFRTILVFLLKFWKDLFIKGMHFTIKMSLLIVKSTKKYSFYQQANFLIPSHPVLLLNNSPQNKPTEWKKMISSSPNTINFQVSHLIFQSIHLFELFFRVPVDCNTWLYVQGQGCHTIASPMAKRETSGVEEKCFLCPWLTIASCYLFLHRFQNLHFFIYLLFVTERGEFLLRLAIW